MLLEVFLHSLLDESVLAKKNRLRLTSDLFDALLVELLGDLELLVPMVVSVQKRLTNPLLGSNLIL